MTDLQPTIPGLALDLTPTGIAAPLARVETPALVHALGHLAGITNLTHWALGDLTVELLSRGEATAVQVLAGQGHDQATIARAQMVSRTIAPERRREALSWSHHEVVAKLAHTVDEQDRWLERAEQSGWTVRDLRDQILDDPDQPQGALPGYERLPRPPESRLRAALKESPVVVWIPGVGQLSPAHVRAIDTIRGERVAVVTIDPALAEALPVEERRGAA